MDIPKAVSVLQQLYDIPISVSTAYTYRKSYKERTHQAKRHTHSQIVDISLHKSTRDANVHVSINSHFATADVQYFLSYFDLQCMSTIARDNKAKVHCDVEVIQRPSKSWVKVRYSDHDWQKNSDRTLVPTTYQLVSMTDLSKEENVLCELDGIPMVKTRVTGPGLSIIKSSLFEQESCFRHMNELLFVLSLEEFKYHFMRDGEFVSQLLITVDGGGDERPRNKQTHFNTGILRWLLDMDKVKTISFAEGDSKLHSVERVHLAENRALSQNGVISSYNIHSDETDEYGFKDLGKMKENMEAAASLAVQRIKGTSFAGGHLQSYRGPSVDEWVFPLDCDGHIRSFLSRDTNEFRNENNFVLRPRGPIWEKLCTLYGLDEFKVISASRLFNQIYEPNHSWQQKYGFTVYRPDEDWRGDAQVRRFEIQTILDVGRLPEYHYLPYVQVEKLVSFF
ncbi:uncharacterized protein LOC110465207 [Mizuhopecten yessoensis]|uniref:uncharacterized protein LOC110465207 n=1 Tax=Mizuhopecten yessoensis TaxID=6573 RepID=UPI000B457C8E|nr:uncharacterized protein LOC110465207 [Mizuhopecten yessoensis]XP_021376554.1 uncharacterized protein LOC110465207 [Mizuhopecten yessoensis]